MVSRTNHIGATEFGKAKTRFKEYNSLSNFNIGSYDLTMTLRTQSTKQKNSGGVGAKLARKLYTLTKAEINHHHDRQF